MSVVEPVPPIGGVSVAEAARRAVRQSAGPRPATVDGTELVALLDRALYDLERAWPGAAADAIGRARALLVQEPA